MSFLVVVGVQDSGEVRLQQIESQINDRRTLWAHPPRERKIQSQDKRERESEETQTRTSIYLYVYQYIYI